MNIVVCIKQVPDTTEIKIDPVKGTLIRDGVPSIMNPDDKGGLELALRMKDNYGANVTVITMGPPQAELILREAMAMGADRAILLTDRKFAGADTLATSYALAGAMKTMDYDLIIAGRQAIDGDTAQVGPQVAEKLELAQITYAEELVSVSENEIVIKRRLDRGVETVKTSFPVLITVHGNAKDCRPRHAKRVIMYKNACSISEGQQTTDNGHQSLSTETLWERKPFLKIEEWNADDINPDFSRLGMSGSPTKVKSIENVVLTSKKNKIINNSESEINELMKELVTAHII